MGNKSWAQLSPTERKLLSATIVAQLLLQVSALLDLRRRPAGQVNGSKRAWVAATFINWLGPLAYFGYGRKRR